MTGFINENVLSMQNEAPKIMIYLAPIVFNINIELYIIEGALHDDISQIRIIKELLRSQCESKDKVSLLYRFTRYDVIYTKEFYEKYHDYIDIEKTYNAKDSMDRVKDAGLKECEKCKKHTNYIDLSSEFIYPVCRECLIIFVKDRMTERVRNNVAETFNNIECIII